LPARHVPSEAHQPQLVWAEHDPQVVYEGQVELTVMLLGHVVEIQLQEAEQLPLPVGPAKEPTWHVFDAPHQPQAARCEHSEQLRESLQGSVALTPQVDEIHAHCDEHVPVLGPLPLPTLQVPEAPHQPQAGRCEHETQS